MLAEQQAYQHPPLGEICMDLSKSRNRLGRVVKLRSGGFSAPVWTGGHEGPFLARDSTQR
jgi:hypothetical protein